MKPTRVENPCKRLRGELLAGGANSGSPPPERRGAREPEAFPERARLRGGAAGLTVPPATASSSAEECAVRVLEMRVRVRPQITAGRIAAGQQRRPARSSTS